MRARHWLLLLAGLPSACFAVDWDEYYRRELEITGCEAEAVEGERVACGIVRKSRDRMKEEERQREPDRAREAESPAPEVDLRSIESAWQARCSKKGQPRVGMTRAQLLLVIKSCWDVYTEPTSLETAGAVYETIPLISPASLVTVHLRNGIVTGIHREGR